MNIFTLTLCEVLRRNDVTRKRIQEKTDVGYPAISKYLNGKAMPKPKILAKIMSDLPHQDAAELFSAYLQELFSDYTNVEDLLAESKNRASDSSPCLNEDTIDYSAVLPKSKEVVEIDQNLAILKELALRKPEVADMLKAIVKTMKP